MMKEKVYKTTKLHGVTSRKIIA